MKIPFIKMEGAGNDYVYIDLIKNSNELDFKNLDYKDLAQKISQRHFEIGRAHV